LQFNSSVDCKWGARKENQKNASNVSTCLWATLDNQHSKQMETHTHTLAHTLFLCERDTTQQTDRRIEGQLSKDEGWSDAGAGKSELVFDIDDVIVILLVMGLGQAHSQGLVLGLLLLLLLARVYCLLLDWHSLFFCSPCHILAVRTALNTLSSFVVIIIIFFVFLRERKVYTYYQRCLFVNMRLHMYIHIYKMCILKITFIKLQHM